MNSTLLWFTVIPFAIAGAAYLFAAAGYQFVLSRPGLAVAMVSYTVACAGLVYDALTVTGGK